MYDTSTTLPAGRYRHTRLDAMGTLGAPNLIGLQLFRFDRRRAGHPSTVHLTRDEAHAFLEAVADPGPPSLEALLWKAIGTARTMREAQRQYLRTRARTDLDVVKRWEARTDAALAALPEREVGGA